MDDTSELIMVPGSVIAHGFAGLVDKTMALLWGLWLLAGPGMEAFTGFLFDVVSISADQGLESNICDIGNILPEFATKLGVTAPRSFSLCTHLFKWLAVPIIFRSLAHVLH